MPNYATYARVVLSNSECFSNLIRKYSTLPVETRRTGKFAISQLKVLTQQQIDEAFLNPQNSYRRGIKSYAAQLKSYKKIIDAQLLVYDQLRLIDSNIKELHSKINKSAPVHQKELNEAIKKLQASYKKLTSIQGQLNSLVNALPALKPGTLLALIIRTSPVRGLRPVLAARSRTRNVPNPTRATGSPRFSDASISPIIAFKVASATILETSATSAIRSMSIFLFIAYPL